MPACAFTISASAQKVIPSPYGRQRPCRQVTSAGSSSMYAKSSATTRLAYERHKLYGLFALGFVEGAAEEAQISLPPDERGRHRADHVRAETGARGERLPQCDRLGLSLCTRRLER